MSPSGRLEGTSHRTAPLLSRPSVIVSTAERSSDLPWRRVRAICPELVAFHRITKASPARSSAPGWGWEKALSAAATMAARRGRALKNFIMCDACVCV